MGLRVQGSRFKVQDSGFKIQDSWLLGGGVGGRGRSSLCRGVGGGGG